MLLYFAAFCVKQDSTNKKDEDYVIKILCCEGHLTVKVMRYVKVV